MCELPTCCGSCPSWGEQQQRPPRPNRPRGPEPPSRRRWRPTAGTEQRSTSPRRSSRMMTGTYRHRLIRRLSDGQGRGALGSNIAFLTVPVLWFWLRSVPKLFVSDPELAKMMDQINYFSVNCFWKWDPLIDFFFLIRSNYKVLFFQFPNMPKIIKWYE